MIGLSELLAHEVRRNNIRVMALTPSTVATDLSIGSLIPEDKVDQYMHPDDLAEYIVSQLKLDPRIYIKTASLRSEERRVGKESRSKQERTHNKKTRYQ